MTPKAIALAVVALAGTGVAGYSYFSERSRLSVREKNTAVQGQITKAYTTGSGTRRSRYKHWIDYQYQVDGKTYAAAECRVQSLPGQGGPVRVWIDPADPSRCISDPELAYGMEMQWVIIGAVAAVVTLFGAVREVLRSSPKSAPA